MTTRRRRCAPASRRRTWLSGDEGCAPGRVAGTLECVAEQYAEREVKFDVDADFAVPQLDDLTAADAAVRTATLHLDSTYYDTAGCDLLKSSVTLRRRSGGDDDT